MSVRINVSLASLIRLKSDMEYVMVKYPEYFGSLTPGSIDYLQYGEGKCSLSEKDVWGNYNPYKAVICLEIHNALLQENHNNA